MFGIVDFAELDWSFFSEERMDFLKGGFLRKMLYEIKERVFGPSEACLMSANHLLERPRLGCLFLLRRELGFFVRKVKVLGISI